MSLLFFMKPAYRVTAGYPLPVEPVKKKKKPKQLTKKIVEQLNVVREEQNLERLAFENMRTLLREQEEFGIRLQQEALRRIRAEIYALEAAQRRAEAERMAAENALAMEILSYLEAEETKRQKILARRRKEERDLVSLFMMDII